MLWLAHLFNLSHCGTNWGWNGILSDYVTMLKLNFSGANFSTSSLPTATCLSRRFSPTECRIQRCTESVNFCFSYIFAASFPVITTDYFHEGPVDDNNFLFIFLKQCYLFLLNGILSLVTKVEKRKFFIWSALHRIPRNIKRFKRCSINQWQGRHPSQALREFKTRRCFIHTCWGNRPWMKRTALLKTNCNCSMERKPIAWNPSMCRDLTGVCAEFTVRTFNNVQWKYYTCHKHKLQHEHKQKLACEATWVNHKHMHSDSPRSPSWSCRHRACIFHRFL